MEPTRLDLLARLEARASQQADILLQISQNMARLGEVMDRTMANQDTHLTRLAEILVTQNALLARQDERLARQDEILAQLDARGRRQDEILARIDEHTTMLAQILARFDQGRNGH